MANKVLANFLPCFVFKIYVTLLDPTNWIYRYNKGARTHTYTYIELNFRGLI